MRWTIVAAIVAGFAAGVGATATVRAFRNGVYYSTNNLEEKIHFEDEAIQPFVQYRAIAHIPAEYGKLISITNNGTFWFEDEKGVIRNVTVEDSRALAIERKGRLMVREP